MRLRIATIGRTSCSALVIASLVLTSVVGCSRSDSASSPSSTSAASSTQAVVAADGVHIDLGPVRVSADASVAPLGTTITVSRESVVTPIDTTLFHPFAPAVDVQLADGTLQPRANIELSFDLDRTAVESQVTQGNTPVVVTRNAHGDIDILPATWDGTASKLRAASPHLSGFWPGWLDAKAMATSIADGIAAALNLRFPKPDCVGASAELNGVTLSAAPVDRDVAWPCVAARDGRFEVALHSNSAWVWLAKTVPAAQSFEVHGRDLAGALAAGIYYESRRGKTDNTSVLVPGDTTTIPYDATNPPVRGEMQTDAGLSLVSVMLSEINAAAQLLGVKLGLYDDLAKSFDKLTCLAGVVEGLNQLSANDFGAKAGALGKAMIDCIGAIGGAAGAVVLGVVAGLISSLFVSVGGLWNSATRQDKAFFSLALTRPNAATDHGYHRIALGMTANDALAVLAPTVRDTAYYSHCRVISDQPDKIYDFSVWIDTTKNIVTGIETPPGTQTDRNVGDGSTPAQVIAAYTADYTIEQGFVGGQGSPAILARPKTGDQTHFLCFPIKDDGNAGPPSIGRRYAAEGC